MKRQLDVLLFELRRIGMLGWLGMVLLAASAAYTLFVVPQRQDEMDGARAQTARLERRMAVLAKAPESATDSGTGTAMDLPTVKMTGAALLKLEGIASAQKLRLKRNDYRYVERIPQKNANGAPAAKASAPDPALAQDSVVEVHIAMPVGGNYRGLRAFLGQAMEDLPTLALENMSLTRDSIAQGDLQGQLRFVLFVRRDP